MGSLANFDKRKFFDDVARAVNEHNTNGFNALERHVAQLLSTEEERSQLTEAVDTVFSKVQLAADKNLQRWERYCEANCFHVPETLDEVDEEQDEVLQPDPADIAAEAELDSELDRLRTRILSVRKETSKLNRERQTLETWLSVKRTKIDVVNQAAAAIDEPKLSAMQGEISDAAAKLHDQMKKAEEETLEPKELDTKTKVAVAKLLDEIF